jgi:hypothetical protein
LEGFEKFAFLDGAPAFAAVASLADEAPAFKKSEHGFENSKGGLWTVQEENSNPALAGAAVILVGEDDGLDERVADDIFFGEEMHGNALHIAEGGGGFDEAAEFVAGEVDLGDIAGDNATGTDAEAGEEHEHLLGGGVLRLVEDDEGIAQRAAAHVGQRGDLDDIAGHEFLQFVSFEEVVEGVVERAEVGKDFFLEVARQEAKGLAGFDGWAGEDDAFDFFLLEGGDGTGDGEVLPVPAGPIPKVMS